MNTDDTTIRALREALEDLEAAAAQPVAQPGAGEWVSVPREPTEAMYEAALGPKLQGVHYRSQVKSQWQRMLAAAPQPPSAPPAAS